MALYGNVIFGVVEGVIFFGHNVTLKGMAGCFLKWQKVTQEGPTSGLSMIILHAGDKSPVQQGFFPNSAGDLLPALQVLGGLYNFCNLVIIFSLM